MSRPLRLAGGWAGVLAPVVYVATWAVLGATRPGYDPVRQAISELGEQGASTAPAMSLGFVVFGLLGLPFAAALRRTLPVGGRLARVVAATAALCGLATIGAAVLPCSPGCPGPGATATDTGHAVVAVVGYLALMGTPLLVWLALRRTDSSGWRRFGRWSLTAGALGSALMLGWALGWFGDAGGAAQRGFNTLADAWWATAGVAVIRTRDRI
jgi:hypothetical protein